MSSIRSASPRDQPELAVLRGRLWPSGSGEEHARDLERYFAGTAREPLEILVAEDADGVLLGFCELSIRAYAESCSSDDVGYLEGWYVLPEHRRAGVGRALVSAAEDWARGRGCTEFASDAEAANQISIDAHFSLGFEDAGVIRCFRKSL